VPINAYLLVLIDLVLVLKIQIIFIVKQGRKEGREGGQGGREDREGGREDREGGREERKKTGRNRLCMCSVDNVEHKMS
jgi:hypothetical protein